MKSMKDHLINCHVDSTELSASKDLYADNFHANSPRYIARAINRCCGPGSRSSDILDRRGRFPGGTGAALTIECGRIIDFLVRSGVEFEPKLVPDPNDLAKPGS